MELMREPEVTSRIMSSIRSKGGKAETLLGKTMWALGLRYRKQYPIKGKPDYVFTRVKIAVFCDGDFWHGRDFYTRLERGRFKRNIEYWMKKIPANIDRDKKVTHALQEQGWLVVRFWESDILRDPIGCARIVKELYQLRLAELDEAGSKENQIRKAFKEPLVRELSGK